MSRIQRNDEALRRVQSHLNRYLDHEVAAMMTERIGAAVSRGFARRPNDSRRKPIVMEAARIKEFAAEFDPQPFHIDESAAEASVFKGLAASGWHTAAVAMRLLVTGGLPFANGIVGLGGEIAWPRPTRPGDILHVESEIVEITPSRSKPHQGIVTVRSTMFNQNGEAVYRADGQASGVEAATALILVVFPEKLAVDI